MIPMITGTILQWEELFTHLFEEHRSKEKLERGEYIHFKTKSDFYEAVRCGLVKPSDVKRVRYDYDF